MTDNDQLHQEFLNDFTELLRRYNAEFYLGSGHYGEISEIYFNSIYENGEMIRDFSSITPPNIYPN